jgi:glycosyltransferase involved in cell wall biosynthesis
VKETRSGKEMKVLALNFNQKGMGTWRRSFYFSRELARRGNEVTLVTVSRRSRFRPLVRWKREWIAETDDPHGEGPWVRVIEGPAWGNRALPGWGSGPLDIWARLRELQTGGYDAVIGFEHHPNVSWPVYLARPSKHFVFLSDWCDWFAGSSNQFRGWTWAHRVDSYFEEKIRRVADRVSVTSRLLFRRALAIGIARERVQQIPEGAATDYIVPQGLEGARRQLNIPAGLPLVVVIRNGDMCREVEAFREVLRHVPDAVLMMVGNTSTSALALAERLGILSRVLNTGWVSDADYPQYLACADVCFCPLEGGRNDRARWPAKILDFLSAGRATVTNPVGEVARLFRNHEIGVLAGQSATEMGRAIATLIEKPELRRHLGLASRQLMLSEWDWQFRGPQIAALLAK